MSLQEYKCPSCGGAIEFDSTIQKVKCPYCDTEFDMEALRVLDEELSKEQPDNMNWGTLSGEQWGDEEIEGMIVYGCKSCGGEIVGDQNTAATSCPYCGNPVVIMGKFFGALRPDYVIPFKLDKEAAKEKFIQHLKGKILLPKVFKEQNRIEEIKGIYVPFWLFDADADAKIRYKGTKVRTWSDRDYDYTMTSFYSIIREGNISFEQVPVDGSTKLDDDLMESIEPYNYKDTVDFQTPYLAGYFADKYDVTADDSVERANERVKRSTEDAFLSTVKGYVAVTSENSNIRLNNGMVKYALLPVWLLSTIWRGNKYTFAMNGQTGKFVGNLPLDKGEYWKWFGIVTAISSIAIYIIAKLAL